MGYDIWFTSTPLVSNLNTFLTGLTLCKQVMTHCTSKRRLTNRERKFVI